MVPTHLQKNNKIMTTTKPFFFIFVFVFLLLFTSVSSLTIPSIPQDPQIPLLSICNTDNPGNDLRNAHAALLARDRQDDKRLLLLHRRQESTSRPRLNIDLYMHFVTSKDQAAKYNPTLINTLTSNQANVLNNAFAPANITFTRQPPTYTVNDEWSQDSTSSTPMKRTLRRGLYNSLNLYFQTNLSTPPPTPGAPRTILLGTCTLPTRITYNIPPSSSSSCPPSSSPCPATTTTLPPSSYTFDGCNILAGTLPGQPSTPDSNLRGYNLGGTAVHEVGHWMGLLHTFQGNTCRVGDPGDFIDDTNQQRVATQGCPATFKDSCGLGPQRGGDPVENFMDYSSDFCYERFSPNQNTRMRDMFRMLRDVY